VINPKREFENASNDESSRDSIRSSSLSPGPSTSYSNTAPNTAIDPLRGGYSSISHEESLDSRGRGTLPKKRKKYITEAEKLAKDEGVFRILEEPTTSTRRTTRLSKGAVLEEAVEKTKENEDGKKREEDEEKTKEKDKEDEKKRKEEKEQEEKRKRKEKQEEEDQRKREEMKKKEDEKKKEEEKK
ncbi:hypothetical protein PFISCL1PPCAC_27175, partial [Pristionchus fissidentatus]